MEYDLKLVRLFSVQHVFWGIKRRISKLSKNKINVATRPIPNSFSQALKDNVGAWI
jgi:hypothetical protein